MVQLTIRCAAVAALVMVGTVTAAEQTPTAPVKASLDRLSWIAGAWTGTLGDRTIEQHWSAPLGGSIVAMYRSIQNNKTTLYELLAIEQDGDGVSLRIKHFAPGPGLVGQEAKDESANHALVKLEDRLAVFEGGSAASPVRITFRSPDSASLNITVERTRNGAPVSTEFKYTRIIAK